MFWEGIASHPEFDYTNLSSGEIARRLRACSKVVRVQHHRFDSAKTVAVTDPGWPYRIYYSSRKEHLNRTESQKVNTLVHEFVHNVDLFDDGTKADFTHSDSGPVSEKQGTAPYWIGDLAQSIWELDNQHVPRAKKSTEEPGNFVCYVGSIRHDEREER